MLEIRKEKVAIRELELQIKQRVCLISLIAFRMTACGIQMLRYFANDNLHQKQREAKERHLRDLERNEKRKMREAVRKA